ncbi:hypothetical protein E2C01_093018 [Portunus trituberculatus]|uniref:Uncharacterized protein n=1 Tax=Portunus trituberculatus TaxID=210409 RepID=A0A5B7JNQ6_PORTR|nr:hypothetical protein [Portunus trituberculatus]
MQHNILSEVIKSIVKNERSATHLRTARGSLTRYTTWRDKFSSSSKGIACRRLSRTTCKSIQRARGS